MTSKRPRSVRAAAAPSPTTLSFSAAVTGWSDVQAAEGKPKLRSFSMEAYTGGPMVIYGFYFPLVIDLSGLQISGKPRPILMGHNTEQIVGHTTSVENDGRSLIVAGVISGVGEAARSVVETSMNGFPWQASVGARIRRLESVKAGETVEVNGQLVNGPVLVARATTLQEVSFVPLGADDNTSARVAASRKAVNMAKRQGSTNRAGSTIAAGGTTTLNDIDETSIEAGNHDEIDTSIEAGAQHGDVEASDVIAQLQGDAVKTIRAGAAAEHKRIAAITAAAKGHSEILAKAIEDGWTTDKTELEVLRAERKNAPPMAGGGGGGNVSAAACEASMLLATGVSEERVGKLYPEKVVEAAMSRDMRGMGLQGLCARVIAATGGWAQAGSFGDDTIKAAFEADRQIRGSYGFSTLSLTGILSNVANKTLLSSFLAVESVVPLICAEADNSDFKRALRYRLTAQGKMEKIGAGGELQLGTMTDEPYGNQVDTFGRLIAITRQMMINDDLGAFTQIPRMLGRMAALSREEAVFTLLLANPGSFFAAGNKNFITGADTALSINALTVGEQAFLDQVDSAGKPIMLSPAVLLVPTSLKTYAGQIWKDTAVSETTSTDKPKPASNPHAGKWTPASSPFLNAQGISGGSAKAWYLFADPATGVAAIEVAYLRGQRTPTIQSAETDFSTLGVQMRGFWDFGVEMQDFRGAVKSKGEA